MKWRTQKEGKGNLPYIVVWVALNGLISVAHCETIKQAEGKYNYLKSLGREPTILAVLTCE